jgi:hypothetical protein
LADDQAGKGTDDIQGKGKWNLEEVIVNGSGKQQETAGLSVQSYFTAQEMYCLYNAVYLHSVGSTLTLETKVAYRLVKSTRIYNMT